MSEERENLQKYRAPSPAEQYQMHVDYEVREFWKQVDKQCPVDEENQGCKYSCIGNRHHPDCRKAP